MCDCARKRRKSHDKNACSDGFFQFESQKRRQDEQHHHTAARADKTANHTYSRRKRDGLNNGRGFIAAQIFFQRVFFIYGTQNKFQTEKGCDKNRETSHHMIIDERRKITAYHREAQYDCQHEGPFFEVDVFIDRVCGGRNRRRKHVGNKRYSYGVVCGEIEKGNEHRRNKRGRRQPRETRAESRAYSREYVNDYSGPVHINP